MRKLLIGFALTSFLTCFALEAKAVPVCDPNTPVNCTKPNSDGTVNVSDSRSYKNITTGATTTVKSGLGALHSIIVNTFVASATITVYDNTAASGTKIATITLPSTITSDAPVTINYDIGFATGLTIVTSGATDITVSYR